jgi:hypothetical protein
MDVLDLCHASMMFPRTIVDMERGQYFRDKIKKVIKLIIMFKAL